MHKKIFALIVVDQITKLVFWSRDFFVGAVHVHSVKNFALAFSLDFGALANLAIVVIALAYFIYYYFQQHKNFNLTQKMFFIFIFAGAISNLGDRIYLGYVRDIFDVGLNFTFNLADIFLIIGLVGFLLRQNQEPV